MKGIIRSYFNYSRRQMRGILVLVLLIFISFMFPLLFNFYSEDKVWDHSDFVSEIEKFNANQNLVIQSTDSVVRSLFLFDPNTVTADELQQLGIPDKVANTLIKYRNAGGEFKNKQDLKKVYGIDNQLYKQLAPYIFISDKNQEKKIMANEHLVKQDSVSYFKSDSAKPVKNTRQILIELNTADSTQWVLLNGIGPVISRRIINYRNSLGGFYSSGQLLEVYGITPELLQQIQNQLLIDTTKIEKINLNNADFKKLNNHPYIEYIDTKNILKFKELMGSFKNADELITNHLMDTARFRKVKPYLIVN